MISFFRIHERHFRHFCARRVLAPAVLLCFLAALTAGCKLDDGGFIDDNKLDGRLIETWTNQEYGDSYIITNDHLTYGYDTNDDTVINYAGSIEYVSNFSPSAGVIIIKYDAGHKQTYYDSPENYGKPDHAVAPKGDYLGVYFKEFKPGVSVMLAGAYTSGGAEEASLEDAKKAFTQGNEGAYITFYGTYEKK